MDLPEELRSLSDCDARSGAPLGKCMRRAADEIERLVARVAELEADEEAESDRLSGLASERLERICQLEAEIAELNNALSRPDHTYTERPGHD